MIRAYRQEEPESGAGPWLEEILQDQQLEQEEEQKLYCFLCGRMITRSSERIPVDGAHQHTFTNPGGYVFQIGCFREAPGCREEGEPTDFYSWFDGYAWSYALCASCRAHLGWVYRRGENSFFGLILNRLVGSRESFPSES